MACVILQDDSGFAEDQPCAVEHPSWSSEDLSRCETKFTEDPFLSPEVPWRWWIMKSHYVAPPPVPTNLESRPIIK
jgi:hypothetical protein